LIHWAIAFCWAVDPVALSVPLPQLLAATGELDPPDLLSFVELEQAASTTAPAMSPAMAPARYSFTWIPLCQRRGND
jgi:hypothetical protein